VKRVEREWASDLGAQRFADLRAALIELAAPEAEAVLDDGAR
jgi:hypothetical protein